MNFPLFVARRIRNTHETSFSKTVTFVGIGTIALGIGIILIAFSILFGFKKAIQGKLICFTGHIKISKISGNHSLTENPISRNLFWENQTKKNPAIHHIQSHLQKPGILVGENGLAGVVIKGIGQDMPVDQINQNLVLGLATFKSPQEIILSTQLANQLHVKVNQSLLLYFLNQPERPRKVKIRGIYETGLEELDKTFVLADRDWVQQMNGWPKDSIGSYEVYIKPNAILNEVAYQVEKEMPADWKLETVEELYPALFDWMSMLDRNIVIFISLLLVVACFNLIATLWVLIMERIPMIGLLKALGSSPKQIRTVFWWNGFFILLRGVLIGNAIAILFCYLQATYKFIPLDPQNYYMNAVPIDWDNLTWMYVNVGTCTLVAFIITIPTYFIHKIQPQEALNFKN